MNKFVFIGALALTAGVMVTAFKPASEIVTPVPALKSIDRNALTKWAIDKPHSNIKFSVTHLVISEVEGSFKDFDGTVEHTKPDFSDAKINFTIKVASIDTDNEKRNGHLKSTDFFDAEKFPEITFTSSSLKPLGSNKYELTGNLTMKGITKPVKFDVTYGGQMNIKDQVKAGFKAKTTINRFDYDLKWNAATETGGLVVSKEVDITINAELNQVK